MGSLEVAKPSTGESVRLPEIQTHGIYEGRTRDRNPQIRAAGKLTATGDTANLCMKPPHERPESPEVIRRFRATIRPDAGKTRVFYGKAKDPHLRWAKEMTHGLCAQPSLMARELVNPQPNSLFKQRLFDKKESIYSSHVKAPIGTSHNQGNNLPRGLDPYTFTFGVVTEKDCYAGELISPDKPRPQVEAESEQGRDLYRRTHFDYRVGEQCNRNYTYPSFRSDSQFGIPTPHDNAGKHVRQTLKWLHDTQSEKAAQVVTKRVDDFRERTQPQLGKVHDPIKDTLNVPADHTFGILLKPDEYGAGDLLHGRAAGHYLRGKDRQRGLIAAMRQHLKKANYHNFDNLKLAFRHYDTDNSGTIDINKLRDACVKFNLPIEVELLEQLMNYCDSNKDGQIDYNEFANFLNWKDKMPSGLTEREDTKSAPPVLEKNRGTPINLQKQIDRAIGDHRTSSSMINAVVGPGGISTRDYRTYGIPTVRTDLPAPRIRRVDDKTSYGEESDAYGLVNPSIYSTRGVYEKDFLMPRSKEEIRQVFSNIGINTDYDMFDSLYSIAASRDPRGQVSVEAFRNVLDECQATAIHSNNAIVY